MARETMQPAGRLRETLRRIDGRGYRAYRDCEGAYAFDGFTLLIDYAQADPFAAPSKARVRIVADVAGFPARCLSTKTRETAFRDFLARVFAAATNMMIRDRRMQELVADEQEPITPFIDRAQALYRDLGVSTVLVIGGSGDYFDIADTVVSMQAYRPEDATARAKAIAARHAPDRIASRKDVFGTFRRPVPDAGSIDASKGRREAKVAADGVRGIRFGVHEIDLSAVAQVVDPAQTAAIAHALLRAKRLMDGKRTLDEVVRAVAAEVEEDGLDTLTPHPVGGLAAFRPLRTRGGDEQTQDIQGRAARVRAPGSVTHPAPAHATRANIARCSAANRGTSINFVFCVLCLKTFIAASAPNGPRHAEARSIVSDILHCPRRARLLSR